MATEDPVALSRGLLEAVRADADAGDADGPTANREAAASEDREAVASADREAAASAEREAAIEDLEATLAGYDPDALADALAADDRRRAFWLNVYNAAVQLGLARDADSYGGKRRFFGADRVTVAGHDLSLDDVEHGMLRRSRWKWGLGYVPHPFPGDFERALRVAERDYRVHFALNCGARSCPPIASYDPEGLDRGLDAAAGGYLESEVTFGPDRSVVRVPRQCLWYRGDFGGGSGIRAMLRRYGLLGEDESPRIRYLEYDWRPEPRDFLE